MALIDCPECGAKVSEKAPSCPQCGFPIAASREESAAAVESPTQATASEAPQAQAAEEPQPLATERSAEPFRIAGRRIPIAGLLFWGGLTVGLILKATVPEGVETPYRYVPYTMIFLGVLWFSVTELVLLIRHRKRR